MPNIINDGLKTRDEICEKCGSTNFYVHNPMPFYFTVQKKMGLQ